MLCLSRRKNEVTVLTLPDGSRCEVSVIAIGPNRVRLGFEFPQSVSIHREEVQVAVDEEAEPKVGLGRFMRDTRRNPGGWGRSPCELQMMLSSEPVCVLDLERH